MISGSSPPLTSLPLITSNVSEKLILFGKLNSTVLGVVLLLNLICLPILNPPVAPVPVPEFVKNVFVKVAFKLSTATVSVAVTGVGLNANDP